MYLPHLLQIHETFRHGNPPFLTWLTPVDNVSTHQKKRKRRSSGVLIPLFNYESGFLVLCGRHQPQRKEETVYHL